MAIKKFLKSLGIKNLSDNMTFIFGKPLGRKTRIKSWEESPFWNIKGNALSFFSDLQSKEFSPEDFSRSGYITSEDRYYLNIKLADIKKLFANKKPLDVFYCFENLIKTDTLKDIKFKVKKEKSPDLDLLLFSEGELQLIFSFAINYIFNDDNFIFLLDEPDSFLHPVWESKFLDSISQAIKKGEGKNQILINTHCPSTVFSSTDDNLILFEKIRGKIKSRKTDRKEAISILSDKNISIDEEEFTLSVINKIENSNKPMLFTEGVSDINVLKIAWRKLYGRKSIPFDIQSGFSCKMLAEILKDEKSYNKTKFPLFGLFDFDEAYNDWNSLGGEVLESNPLKGLCKKVKEKNGFGFLLPIPDISEIKNQVINPSSSKTYRHESRMQIEHLFYQKDSPNFEKVPDRGGNLIKFKGDKTKFSKKIEDLGKEYFEVFEPLFEKIIELVKRN